MIYTPEEAFEVGSVVQARLEKLFDIFPVYDCKARVTVVLINL